MFAQHPAEIISGQHASVSRSEKSDSELNIASNINKKDPAAANTVRPLAVGALRPAGHHWL